MRMRAEHQNGGSGHHSQRQQPRTRTRTRTRANGDDSNEQEVSLPPLFLLFLSTVTTRTSPPPPCHPNASQRLQTTSPVPNARHHLSPRLHCRRHHLERPSTTSTSHTPPRKRAPCPLEPPSFDPRPNRGPQKTSADARCISLTCAQTQMDPWKSPSAYEDPEPPSAEDLDYEQCTSCLSGLVGTADCILMEIV
jgi:hypothetical protein